MWRVRQHCLAIFRMRHLWQAVWGCRAACVSHSQVIAQGRRTEFYAGMRRRRVIRAVDNNRISTAENKGFCNLAVCVWKRNCGYYDMRRASCLGRVLVAAMLRVATSRSK